MRISDFLLPTLKETPAEAKIASHRLMLRAGMVRQLTSGIYNWLPLGLKVLRNVEEIVRQEMDKAGVLEILMPTLQPAKLWQESGRYESYGKEMLRIQDRHKQDLLYGPTAEEVVTDIFRDTVKSYKDLPLMMYQISWKFRDEIRPRFGVMRGREFLMKDAYSFASDYEAAKEIYDLMYEAYLKIFKRLGLTAIPVKADTGAIGGDLSHEFQVLAETGESDVYYDAAFDSMIEQDDVDIESMRRLYAMADEMHIPQECPIGGDQLRKRRGIEVGHIFYFGDKYTKALKAQVQTADGKPGVPLMGSYGIGISRLVGAIIEANHDDSGIIWPKSVAPFKVALINLKVGDAACDTACEGLYHRLKESGVEVLYHNTKGSVGQKFATMDLIGIPWQLAVGPRGIADDQVELKRRKTGQKENLSLASALEKMLTTP